jgi:hypothetical protein
VVRQEACDGFVIGGGVARVLEQATLAAAFDKPFWLQMVGTGLTTALSLHLGAVLPAAQWPSVNCLNIYSDDLLVEALTIEGGYARVPGGPGLGVEVDEAALTCLKMEPPYELPRPRLLLSIAWPDGRARHYANIDQCRVDALSGSLPAQQRGARMEVRPDDGTPEWTDLYTRAKDGPVFSRP